MKHPRAPHPLPCFLLQDRSMAESVGLVVARYVSLGPCAIRTVDSEDIFRIYRVHPLDPPRTSGMP